MSDCINSIPTVRYNPKSKIGTGAGSYSLRSVLLVLWIFYGGCTLDKEKFSISGTVMGTTYTIKILEKDRVEDVSELVDGELDRLETIFSTYQKDSEISKFNDEYEIEKFYPLSPEFLEVWDIAEEIRQQSEEAFSPVLGRVVEAWGFGASDNNVPLPNEILETIIRCQNSILFERLDQGILPRKAPQSPAICMDRKIRPKLDFSGIAKGYAVDRIMDVLRQNGIDSAMVEIGGDLCVRSSTHEPYFWKIGIRKPKSKGISKTLELQNGCVATSGNAYQTLLWEGKQYSHILNPKTQYPLEAETSSVTVVFEKGTRPGARSDAWATALFVIGEKSQERFLEKYGFRVYWFRER